MEEAKKTIKVDAYDFFGYLIPGFILLVSLLSLHIPFVQFNFQDCPGISGVLKFEVKSYQFVSIILITILLSYVLGHVVASIASFVFEKVIVKNIFGYPYWRLMFSPEEKLKALGAEESQINELKADYFRSLTIVFYFLVLFFCFSPFLTRDIAVNHYIVVSLIVSLYAITLLLPRRLQTVLVCPLSFIFRKFEKLVDLFVGHHRPMPNPVRKLFFKKFYHDFKVKPEDVDSEVFWAVYWKVVQGDTYIKGKIDKWLVLYSFMRNLGCALLIGAVAMSVRRLIYGELSILKIHSIVLLVFSIILTIRYYYLYYSYYSKSIFRIYLYLNGSVTSKNKPRKFPKKRVHC